MGNLKGEACENIEIVNATARKGARALPAKYACVGTRFIVRIRPAIGIMKGIKAINPRVFEA